MLAVRYRVEESGILGGRMGRGGGTGENFAEVFFCCGEGFEDIGVVI